MTGRAGNGDAARSGNALRQRPWERAEALTAQLFDSAPEPDDLRSAGGRQVKGNRAAAGLIRRPDIQFLPGVLEQPLPHDRVQAIRRARNAMPHERDQDPFRSQ